MPLRAGAVSQEATEWGAPKRPGGLHAPLSPHPSACPHAALDLRHLQRAAELSQQPIGQTQPHPYAGCVLVGPQGQRLAEASQWAQVRAWCCCVGCSAV